MKNTSLLFLYFNSIKVRLEPILGMHNIISLVFQFHKGTIRTEYGPTTFRPHYQFQFHKGTIRTRVLANLNLEHQANFNSIKVRLEPTMCKLLNYLG